MKKGFQGKLAIPLCDLLCLLGYLHGDNGFRFG